MGTDPVFRYPRGQEEQCCTDKDSPSPINKLEGPDEILELGSRTPRGGSLGEFPIQVVLSPGRGPISIQESNVETDKSVRLKSRGIEDRVGGIAD